MKGKFIQVNCVEGDKIDARQAEAVLKYKPDIIILEYPLQSQIPDTSYNNFNPKNKPWNLLQEQIESLEKYSVNSPWLKSDVLMWKNIKKLWKRGHDIKIYRTDAPAEIVTEWNEVWKNMYPCAEKNWLWWVKIYLREKYMAKNIKWFLSKNQLNDDTIVLVFLQSFHWNHVKFLLKDPSKDKIWEYYFGKFSEVTKSNIAGKIKAQNKLFYKYWKIISDF